MKHSDIVIPGNMFDPEGKAYLSDMTSLPKGWREKDGVILNDEKEPVWLLEE